MEAFVYIATLAPLGEQRHQKVAKFVVAQTFDGAGEIRRAIVDRILAGIHDVAIRVHGLILSMTLLEPQPPWCRTCSTLPGKTGRKV
jgi:hypothetical protein